jgi:hypothetical protein
MSVGSWEDNIKRNLQELELEDMDWVIITRKRNTWRALVNAVINTGFHKKRGIS